MSTKIKLLSHDIALKVSDPGTWEANGMGRCSLLRLEIQVNKHMPPHAQGSTLVHELIHMIADMHSVELTEHQVDSLALGVFSFIRENPKLVAKLTKGEPL